MKKMMSILVALVLVLSMTAFAAVPSKTTTDNTQVQVVETVSGVEVKDDFKVVVTEDAAPVAQEIAKLYTYVAEQKQAPVTYLPAETQEQVKAALVAQIVAATVGAEATAEDVAAAEEQVDLSALELNEFITVQPIAYEAEYGDIKTSFSFVTEYKVGQKVVALLSIYTGEVDENGEFIVEWVVLEAEVQEDGSVAVIIPQAEMLKMQTAEAVALAVLSEAVAE